MLEQLRWKKYPVLNDGFICLVDVMGDDSAIVQAARVSYGKDETQELNLFEVDENIKKEKDWDGKPFRYSGIVKMSMHGTVMSICEKDNIFTSTDCNQQFSSDDRTNSGFQQYVWKKCSEYKDKQKAKDRSLIRRLMMDSHTSPFEMVEFKFKIRVPMDCWRQWIRHRTANVNEYSTRYSEAIDSQQTTEPTAWRLQAKDNKQGSSGFLEEWPEEARYDYNSDRNSSTLRFKDNCSLTGLDYNGELTPGKVLSQHEEDLLWHARQVYEQRLLFGVAREQARKDLPLSTYTEAYWKCDLHNIFNFLRLRLDSHAQLEIRLYAQAMYEIVKQICPIACEAFEDYVLNARKFSSMEMKLFKQIASDHRDTFEGTEHGIKDKPDNMTDNEWKKFLEKIS